jgi:SNF2 family DNA or RNA helicase
MAPINWTPRDYQEEALAFALGRTNSGLLLDPGLGKTSTFLALICVLLERKELRRALVVAPLRVAQTVWPFEAQKWKDFNHLKVCDLCQRTDKERDELLGMGFDVYVINPESLHKVLNPTKLMGVRGLGVPNKWGFDLILSDESTRFADIQTQRFKMLKPVLPQIKYRNIATGTPAPNGLHQLFGQCYFLDDGKALGEYITHFRQMFMHPHPYIQYVYEMNVHAEEQIMARVQHMLLRMRAKDKLAMPELIHNPIRVTLPPAVLKQYKTLERDFLIKVLDETIPAFNKASLGVKCRQVSNGFIYSQEERGEFLPIHDEKLDALTELMEELQGRPLLLMYEFIADGARIMKRFPNAINITGCKNIAQVVADFNAGKIPLLIGHPRSAGHGLNLQGACSDICWFGLNQDLELWLQAIARVWRQGQDSPVVKNHIILSDDTTDDKVLDAITAKDTTQSRVDQALIDYAKSAIR